jgi:hypothetical protein
VHDLPPLPGTSAVRFFRFEEVSKNASHVRPLSRASTFWKLG